MKVVANIDLNSTSKGVNLVDPSSSADSATKASSDLIKTNRVPLSVQIFYYTGSNQTWTKPANCKTIKVTAVGGGGGAGGSDAQSSRYSASGGGGGGGTVITLLDVTSISSATITVGNGGSGGSNTGGNGTSGGDTTVNFGVTGTITANGGLASLGAGNTTQIKITVGGQGGSGTGLSSTNSFIIRGSSGDTPQALSASVLRAGYGGSSYLSGYGNAKAYGGGGSGSVTLNTTSGTVGNAGANGIVIIEEYY